jgi:hypothetical protein
MDDITFKQILFAQIVGMQYHPRNVHASNIDTIINALNITNLAFILFYQDETLYDEGE